MAQIVRKLQTERKVKKKMGQNSDNLLKVRKDLNENRKIRRKRGFVSKLTQFITRTKTETLLPAKVGTYVLGCATNDLRFFTKVLETLEV